MPPEMRTDQSMHSSSRRPAQTGMMVDTTASEFQPPEYGYPTAQQSSGGGMIAGGGGEPPFGGGQGSGGYYDSEGRFITPPAGQCHSSNPFNCFTGANTYSQARPSFLPTDSEPPGRPPAPPPAGNPYDHNFGDPSNFGYPDQRPPGPPGPQGPPGIRGQKGLSIPVSFIFALFIPKSVSLIREKL